MKVLSMSNGRRYGSYLFSHLLWLKMILLLIFSGLGFLALKMRSKKFRYIVLLLAICINGFLMGGFLCPTTAVQNVLSHPTSYIVMFSIPIIVTMFFGRLHCGFVCPFGAVQELLHFEKLSVKIPKKLEKALSYVKYAFLVVLVLGTIVKGSPVMSGAPFKDLFNLTFTPMLVLWTIASLLIYRPFCRFLCPYGAILSLVDRLPTKIYRIEKTSACTNCKLCERKCPAGNECFMCMRCFEICPKDAVDYKNVRLEVKL